MSIPERLNLLVILFDQLQRGTLETYGGPVPAPGWDRVASKGVVLDGFYCANPLCVPARASLMTGKWPHSHGALCFGEGYETLRPGEELLIDRLLENGYHVGYQGIWHLNRSPGDDRSAGYARHRPTGFPYAPHLRMLLEQGGRDGDQNRPVRTPSDAGFEDWRFSVPVPARWTGPTGEHPDSLLARDTADFIRNAPPDRPFAAWCAFGAPHPPILVPEPFASRFSPADMRPPPSFGEPAEGLPRSVRDAPGAQSVRDWDWARWSVSVAAYLGFVAFADDCMARVLDALEASGRAGDTIVAVSCDHGEMLGAHNLYQKSVLYEESIRLPLALRGPGIPVGRRAQLASQVDLAPTLLDLLGLPPLAAAQGRSLAPVVRDPSQRGQDAVFSEFNGNIKGGVYTRAVVTDHYKYVYHHGDRDQLFDLRKDPFELRNLAPDGGYSRLRGDLRDRLGRWMMETGDLLKPVWP